MLTIGELAQATGVATSALRYWEELGLIPTPTRVGGQRRYTPDTVQAIGQILLLRDAGFTLTEINELLRTKDNFRELAERKLKELDERIANAQAAKTAIEHGLACPHEDILTCPTGAGIVKARLAGIPLREAHSH